MPRFRATGSTGTVDSGGLTRGLIKRQSRMFISPLTDNKGTNEMTHSYIKTSELCSRYGRSPKTLMRWQCSRGFPRPVVLGGHGAEARWRECDVKAWEDRQVAA